MKRARLVLAAVLVVGALLYLIIGGIRGAIVYYTTPSELLAQGASAVGRSMRLGGQVAPGSKKWNAQTLDLRFVLTDGTASIPVVHHGAPPDLFTEGQGAVEAARPVLPAAPLVVAVGRLSEQKNPLLLVRAAESITRLIPDAQFVWVGEPRRTAERSDHHHAAGPDNRLFEHSVHNRARAHDRAATRHEEVRGQIPGWGSAVEEGAVVAGDAPPGNVIASRIDFGDVGLTPAQRSAVPRLLILPGIRFGRHGFLRA